MLDAVGRWLFDPAGLTPHGFCLLWQPGLIWLHAVGDGAVGLAYLTIPFAILAFMRRRRDVAHRPVGWLFAAFIMLCGIGHWLELVTLWVPFYGVAGIVKAATAGVSILTAVALWRMMPSVLALPSPAQHREISIALSERQQAETRLVGALKAASAARDEADRANRAKSRFLAGMSHELRTPLNGMLGYAELLRLGGGLNVEQAARVEAMLGAGSHLLQMIHCVLDLSEIETEQMELRLAETDLPGLAGACLDSVRPAADAKRLRLAMLIDPEVPRHVTTDPTRLRQVLLNLLGNAVKFTAHGSVTLHLRRWMNGTELRFEVADTGPGIPLDQRDRIFSEFERLDTEATRMAEGAGLGLALSARFAALLGGRFGYEDNPGGGSRFWIELPLAGDALPVADAAPPPPATIDPEQSPAANLRVLIVDDVAMNRDIARSFLPTVGCHVVCAQSGIEAINVFMAAEFDVVLMDVRMPEMDGLEATCRIRALGGRGALVPIVALTAQVFTEQIEACRLAGMDDHLAKPFTLASLVEAIGRGVACGQRRGLAHSTAPDAAATPGGPAAVVPA